MYNNLVTYKQHLFILLKWLVIVLACFFIIYKLTYNNLLSWEDFVLQINQLFVQPIWLLLLLLLFTDANLILEMIKWKGLVTVEKKIDFYQAMEQVLASLTVSIITPNRIGEYGAKVLFFEKKLRTKIILLNALNNGYQLIATLVFGFIGFYFFSNTYSFENPFYNSKLWLFYIITLSIIITIVIYFNWRNKFFQIIQYIKKISLKKHAITFSLAILRFLVFSHQFYFLLHLFHIEMDYVTAMSLICCMYLLASIIPSINIFDWALKGSIAIWLFEFEDTNSLTILTITTLMWLLNFGIPALLGNIFIANFNKKY